MKEILCRLGYCSYSYNGSSSKQCHLFYSNITSTTI